MNSVSRNASLNRHRHAGATGVSRRAWDKDVRYSKATTLTWCWVYGKMMAKKGATLTYSNTL